MIGRLVAGSNETHGDAHREGWLGQCGQNRQPVQRLKLRACGLHQDSDLGFHLLRGFGFDRCKLRAGRVEIGAHLGRVGSSLQCLVNRGLGGADSLNGSGVQLVVNHERVSFLAFSASIRRGFLQDTVTTHEAPARGTTPDG